MDIFQRKFNTVKIDISDQIIYILIWTNNNLARQVARNGWKVITIGNGVCDYLFFYPSAPYPSRCCEEETPLGDPVESLDWRNAVLSQCFFDTFSPGFSGFASGFEFWHQSIFYSANIPSLVRLSGATSSTGRRACCCLYALRQVKDT